MRAALRDAKRADAIKNRPKAARKAPEPHKVACYVCGSDMVPVRGAQGGICGRCMGQARAAKEEVRRSRDKAERARAQMPRPKALDAWKPKRRKHESGYGAHH